MRIRILHTPNTDDIDGIDLRRFTVGLTYEVGNSLGALMLAEGWAAPASDDDASALLVPFSDADPFVTRIVEHNPPNLLRESYPPYIDELSIAADLDRRRRTRSSLK